MRIAAAFPPDLRHVLPVFTHGFAALAARFRRFIASELVGMSAFVSGFSALAGDLTLAILVHRCEPAVARPLVLIVCHGLVSSSISICPPSGRTYIPAQKCCLTQQA
jgi:hypothetical protein